MTTSPSQGSGEDSHARERRLEKDEKILYIVGCSGVQDNTTAFRTRLAHARASKEGALPRHASPRPPLQRSS